MTHLDAATLRAYRDKRLSPAGLLAADAHLGGCEDCRTAVFDCRKAAFDDEPGAAADSIIDALTTDDQHLDYDTLEAWVDGTLSPAERRAASSHLRSCAQCVSDLSDLRVTAEAIPDGEPSRGMPYKVAAAAMMAGIIGISWFAIRSRTVASSTPVAAPVAAPITAKPRVKVNDAPGSIHIEANGAIRGLAVRGDDAAMLRDALEKGRVDVAARAAALHRERGTLMGATASANPFDVVSPLATLVGEARPRFVWTSLGEQATYRVEVYEDGRQVLQSPELTTTEWTAESDLPRGHEYSWQVVAKNGDERILAPRPPEPEAHFGVVNEAAAARVAAAARSGSHLLYGLAAAREGLLVEARRELVALEKLNPDSHPVRMLVRSLPPR
jgi:hypothetical protein